MRFCMNDTNSYSGLRSSLRRAALSLSLFGLTANLLTPFALSGVGQRIIASGHPGWGWLDVGVITLITVESQVIALFVGLLVTSNVIIRLSAGSLWLAVSYYTILMGRMFAVGGEAIVASNYTALLCCLVFACSLGQFAIARRYIMHKTNAANNQKENAWTISVSESLIAITFFCLTLVVCGAVVYSPNINDLWRIPGASPPFAKLLAGPTILMVPTALVALRRSPFVHVAALSLVACLILLIQLLLLRSELSFDWPESVAFVVAVNLGSYTLLAVACLVCRCCGLERAIIGRTHCPAK